jgi:hypothetical protein
MATVRIQLRRGTASEWTTANPVLAAGETGIETDTRKIKFGDGTTAWSSLGYLNAGDISELSQDAVNTALVAGTGLDKVYNDNANTITLDIDSTVTTNSGAQTLTNKTISGNSNTISLKADTSENWSEDNPVLSAGEIGIETDTLKIKIGTGANWNSITAYANTVPSDLNNTLGGYVLLSEVGGSSGVAGLNNTKDVIVPGSSIIVEGGTTNDFETTLTVTDPTADRTITFPDSTGTVALQSYVDNSISNLIDSAPSTLNTLNELAAAINDDASYASTITTALGTKLPLAGGTMTGAIAMGTSKITGLGNPTDDQDAVTKAYLDTQLIPVLVDGDVGYTVAGLVTGSVPKAQLPSDIVYDADLASERTAIEQTAAADATSQISTHASDTTSVHGITDTAELATKAFAAELLTNATKTNITITGDKTGLTITAENGVADSTTDNLTEGSTNKYFTDERAQDAIGNAVATGLSYNDTTGAISVDTTAIQARVADVSDTEIGYLNGVTSAIQNQIDSKLESSTASSTYAPINAPTFTGTVSGITKSMVGLGDADNTSDANKPVSTATQTALDLKAPIASPTFTGAVTLPGAPTSDLHAATKLYVDNVTAGINFHQAVHAASVNNLAADYANGTSGVGATLTADTNRAFSTLDGESVSVGQRVLIKNQTDAKQNGIYVLTTNGSVSAPWVLTRATDADNNPTGEMKTGDFTFVQAGTVNASVGYINNSTANPIVIGTDNISYTEFNAAKTVVAGNGLQESTPGVLSIDTAITQARVENVSDTEIGYLNGVTSAIQTQMDAKAPLNNASFTGTFSAPSGTITSTMISDGTIVNADINASAAIDWTKLAISSTVSSTEIGYVDGVTSAIQTQLNSKTPELYTFATIASGMTVSSSSHKYGSLKVTSASALNIAVPTDSADAGWNVGDYVEIYQYGDGQITITHSGVTVNSADNNKKTRVKFSAITLIKMGVNEWLLVGDTAA